MNQDASAAAFESLAQRLIKEYWDFYPTAASRLGRHEYDGRLPDLSNSSVRRRVEEVRRGLAQLSVTEPGALAPEPRLSHRSLELMLKRELFNLTELRSLETNPMNQVGYLNVGGYVRRDYAPLAQRLQAATQALRQVPDFLAELDRTTARELGRPVLEMSLESYRGMAKFYRVDLPQAVAGFDDTALLSEFNQAREAAAASLDAFAARLEERRVVEDFAIGPALYSGMLANGEGVRVSLRELGDLGQANLNENLEHLSEVARQIDPRRAVKEIVESIAASHPTAEGLLPDTRAMLEELRQSVLDLGVVNIPSDTRCLVMETPSYMRYAFAALDSPGSLEERSTESFYYVTPVEPDWTPEQQRQWLAGFNYPTLKIISIHEVYPGHFVHFLHNRYGPALPLVNRVAYSYAFTEGWAHYTEQMLLDSGYGAGDPALRLTQLLEALVRNCRYLCSLWMHTQGMTLDEATRFFVDYAYMGEHPARREALRGTFDPGYLNYTLGKLMILKLRDDYRREQGAAYTLRGFHDKLLSAGRPALPAMREFMLREPGESPI